jgi:long-subunit acyl-CoA synthetase (AMP-forming)
LLKHFLAYLSKCQSKCYSIFKRYPNPNFYPNPDPTFSYILTGTTGHPKGVELSYLNYRTNRDTFESFLGFEDQETTFIPVAVNPMHHTNSTSLSDW